jgi:hypothetical protein
MDILLGLKKKRSICELTEGSSSKIKNECATSSKIKNECVT